jgi:F0F1-type ATP synthase membrane subunit c/vacuolar-type H+-ATPase subunit K
MLQILAQTTEFDVQVAEAWSKAGMLGLSLALAAIGLSFVGMNYMKALGRNPEAGKAASSVVIIAAMIEVTCVPSWRLPLVISRANLGVGDLRSSLIVPYRTIQSSSASPPPTFISPNHKSFNPEIIDTDPQPPEKI